MHMTPKLPIYEAKITGMDNTGIFALSFVDFPANEHNFVALKARVPAKLKIDRQKQILTGVVLVPDQLIYRNDTQLGEYMLKFTAADIEKISHKMMRTGLALQTTTHQHEKPLRGNYLTELWTVTDPKRDKSVALGLGELPAGTLVASYKVTDANYWRTEVMPGKVKGFSIEGIFNFNNIKMAKTQTKTPAKTPVNKKASGLGSLLKGIAAMLEGDTAAEADDLAAIAKEDEVDAGEPFLIFTLAEGGECRIDSEGYATLDGEAMPAGEHALDDGNFIVIDDSGMLVATAPEAEGADPAEAATELAAKKRAETFLKIMGKDPVKAAAFLKAGGKTTTVVPAKAGGNAAKIAKLEKELADLKKEPSTTKAKPGTEVAAVDTSKMSYTEKMAAVIKSRRDRQTSKKEPAPKEPAKK